MERISLAGSPEGHDFKSVTNTFQSPDLSGRAESREHLTFQPESMVVAQPIQFMAR